MQGVFALNEYLYENEDASSVSQQALSTGGGAEHILYSLDGVPTMITADGVPVQDEGEIKALLQKHYSNALMPSEAEWAEVKALALKFNDSRNTFMSRYGRGAEELCLQYTGLALRPCDNLQSCTETASMVCALGAPGCYSEVLAPLYVEYMEQVRALNENSGTLFSAISGFSSGNLASSIENMKASAEKMRSAQKIIDKSTLRFPEGEYCADCIGVCPSSHFDYNAMDEFEAKLDAIKARTAPIAELGATARSIHDNTYLRVNYKTGTALLKVWGPKWGEFSAKNAELKKSADEAAVYSSDSAFKASYLQFDKLWTGMQNRMATRNFTGVETDMGSLESLANKMDALAKEASAPYTAALDAKNDATDAIIYARWSVRENDAASVEAYNAFAKQKNGLDSSFLPPTSNAKYAEFATEYASLATDVRAFAHSQKQISEAIGNTGEAFGQTSINAVFSLTDALAIMPASQKAQVAPIIPPAALLAVDLAAISLALVVFVLAIIKFKPLFKKRSVLGAWVALLFVFIFLLGIGSVGMFIVIDNSAQSGTLDDFVYILEHSPSVYTAIDEAGANSASLEAMLACSGTIKSQAKAEWEGIEVYTMRYSGNSCTLSGERMSYDECLSQAGASPMFQLHYSAESHNPKFYTIYQKVADLYGDAAYYNRCEIGEVLH
ncbi:hypothetical protein COU37_00030 [Candidatus Micrarchaeota archaeon CG10_big_fil_rev_8_21_14_0_10_45_29]|nr:MAG: hypothetical protein COU37_00030 [Candidatus Micrarchaeota archaeon CG10_big_fil_rev_8_21_14_0_10_45_29]